MVCLIAFKSVTHRELINLQLVMISPRASDIELSIDVFNTYQ